MFSAKQLLSTLDSDVFDNVNTFAAAVVAFARETFGIFVGQYGAHCSHDSFRNDIFRSNQLDVAFLTGIFCFDSVADFRIVLCDEIHDFVYHRMSLLET